MFDFIAELTDKERAQLASNRKYWGERAADVQSKLTKKNIAQTEEQLRKYYRHTMLNTIGQFEQTYNKLLSTISDGKEPTPADLYKLDTYWKMQGQLKHELQKLGDEQSALFSEQFMKQWQNIYDAMAYKDGLFFNEIDTQAAQAMINEIWCADGMNWSARIWHNTDILQQRLNDTLVECVVTGRKPAYLKKILMQEFGASFNNADMLVRTEMAHIQTQAAKQRYKDAGVKQVQIWADKDERQCKVCGKLHQQIFDVNENVPVPAHPRCRCCIVPVV